MEPIGSKQKFYCKKCGEATTHIVKEIRAGNEVWSCCCCEASKNRSNNDVDKIKSTRKGWKAPPKE